MPIKFPKEAWKEKKRDIESFCTKTSLVQSEILSEVVRTNVFRETESKYQEESIQF